MKFKIGDNVRFLNEKGEGTITKIINKTTVGVTVSDGFEIPYVVSELVFVANENQQKQTIPVVETPVERHEIKQIAKFNKEDKKGIYMAFSPEKPNDIANSDINAWLINYTDYKIAFTYSVLQQGKFVTIEVDAAEAFEPILLETIDRRQLHEFSNFKIDVLFYDTKEHEHVPPLSELVKLKPIKLYKDNAFVRNNFITEKALIMPVSFTDSKDDTLNLNPNTDLAKMLFRKKTEQASAVKTSKPHLHNNPESEMEIDLHIEELMDNFSGMSNFEIVQVQLNSFKKALDEAVNGHYRKLIVIHGVGNGRLKQEVRNILATHNNLRFYDASYAKYGFGATEVHIR